MRFRRTLLLFTGLAAGLILLPAPSARGQRFERIFDGKTLNGWFYAGKHNQGYEVKEGVLVCPKEGGGNLYTEKQYSDFVLRFEYRLEPGGNNGVALRAPVEGNAAYVGMESQILDDDHPMYANLKPAQYHGSIYMVAAAKRGAPKPAGEWNTEEIRATGRRITIKVNGQTIVDADLNKVNDPATLAEHPGILRESGHIGFLGHGALVEFRNIEIRDLSKAEKDNMPPPGFVALFNGTDLKGWKGLVADPPKRAAMTEEQLGAEQARADERMRAHWAVVSGVLVFDGKGDSLCTAKDYADFEMLVDWKIEANGDSGIYLRGSPQVQIWDRAEGSGGLYNNQKNPSNPTKKADRPVGEWNRFRILMVGDKVTVFLNGELVFHNVTMENYWERSKPIYPSGQIELQNHGNTLYFKNIYIREIKAGG